MRIVLAGAVLAVAVPEAFGAQWKWPAPVVALESAEIVKGTISPWWSVSGIPAENGSERRAYRFVAPGTVLYHDTESHTLNGAHTVPRTDDLVVVQHDNGFWSFYAGENLQLSESFWSAGTVVDSDSRFYADGDIAFAVFDAARQVFVNSRAVLPEQEAMPDDGLPVVGFIQNGALTLSRNLAAGEAEFVVPEQWLDPSALPRRIYVLVDGLLQVEIDFTVPEDVAHRVTPDGHLLLLPIFLEPGPVLVEVESHQFDGSVERRTIPFRVPEPAIHPAPVALDTP
ncbi:MAG: hypothetical protein WD492_07155 [Alkalispirochaeta sp.]